jgi:hypothetical protein
VLIAGSTTHYETPDTVKVLNKNNSLYLNIYKDENHKMIHPQIDSIAIRAFYPDYDIVIFDANKKANFYQIFINGQEKKINFSEGLKYLDWNEFIGKVYVGVTQKSPLKVSKDKNADVVQNFKQYYYEVIDVKGDWIKVQCWKDCGGCPVDKKIEGWVKWRDENKLLLDLYYIC